MKQQLKPAAVPDDYGALFINYAAIAWNELRRAWRGDQPVATSRTKYRDSSLRNIQYEDLLLSKEPFEEPIPLSEMVEFLVESWEEEGLYE